MGALEMIDVRMLCLAALMTREASGYDIKKDLERGSAGGLVDASFGSIYPALARLAEDGLIAAHSQGGRGPAGKTLYVITPEGKAHFLRTLSGPIPEEKYRSAFLFAMLFADELPRERVRALIDQQIVAWEAKIAAVDDHARQADPNRVGESFVYGFGQASLRAGLEFIRLHRARVEAAAKSYVVTSVPPIADPQPQTEQSPQAAIAVLGK